MVIDGDTCTGFGRRTDLFLQGSDIQSGDEKSNSGEAIYDETEVGLYEKVVNDPEMVPESPMTNAAAAVVVDKELGEKESSTPVNLALQAKKDLSIIGRFWNPNLENDGEKEISVDNSDQDANNSSMYLAEDIFTKVLSKSQLKKWKKK